MNMEDYVCGTELPSGLGKSITEFREDQLRAEEQFLSKLALIVEAEIKE